MQTMASQPEDISDFVSQKYEAGFYTDIEQDSVPPGLDPGVIEFISKKKGEPQWMLDWRLKAYERWLKMTEPTWAHVHYPPIDLQAISFFGAKVSRKRPEKPR
jgi:Fe-S cluster assembly protein SufB